MSQLLKQKWEVEVVVEQESLFYFSLLTFALKSQIYKMHFQFFDQTTQFFLECILCLEIHENALINGYQTQPKRVFGIWQK